MYFNLVLAFNPCCGNIYLSTNNKIEVHLPVSLFQLFCPSLFPSPHTCHSSSSSMPFPPFYGREHSWNQTAEVRRQRPPDVEHRPCLSLLLVGWFVHAAVGLWTIELAQGKSENCGRWQISNTFISLSCFFLKMSLLNHRKKTLSIHILGNAEDIERTHCSWHARARQCPIIGNPDCLVAPIIDWLFIISNM